MIFGGSILVMTVWCHKGFLSLYEYLFLKISEIFFYYSMNAFCIYLTWTSSSMPIIHGFGILMELEFLRVSFTVLEPFA
jgi:hypothetical protein